LHSKSAYLCLQHEQVTPSIQGSGPGPARMFTQQNDICRTYVYMDKGHGRYIHTYIDNHSVTHTYVQHTYI